MSRTGGEFNEVIRKRLQEATNHLSGSRDPYSIIRDGWRWLEDDGTVDLSRGAVNYIYPDPITRLEVEQHKIPEARPGISSDPDSIIQERHETHGDFSKVATTSQNLKRVLTEGDVDIDSAMNDQQIECLSMIATKIARILHGDPNFSDHWKDIAGYATLAERSCKENGE